MLPRGELRLRTAPPAGAAEPVLHFVSCADAADAKALYVALAAEIARD